MTSGTADTLLLNSIFSAALERKATDVHLMAGNYPVFRLNDKLYAFTDAKILTVDTINTLVEGWLTEAERARLVSDKEVRAAYVWANRARFRATIFYQQGYPAISLRMIPAELPTAKELQIPDILVSATAHRQGLIFICGPFNSGRTTTVASLLQHINTNRSKRIISLERPIEYILVNSASMINQREIGKDTPSFIQGLRDIIDDDVDVVAISELQEEGIQEAVLELAESGKLVIAVLNATSTISALESFLASIAKERRPWAKDVIGELMHIMVARRLVPAVGGGRVLACEILLRSAAVTSIIQEDKFGQLHSVLQTSREEGMIGLDYRLSELVRAGKVSGEVAKKFALDPTNIRG